LGTACADTPGGAGHELAGELRSGQQDVGDEQVCGLQYLAAVAVNELNFVLPSTPTVAVLGKKKCNSCWTASNEFCHVTGFAFNPKICH